MGFFCFSMGIFMLLLFCFSGGVGYVQFLFSFQGFHAKVFNHFLQCLIC